MLNFHPVNPDVEIAEGKSISTRL